MCCRYQGGIFSPKKALTSTNIHLRARSTFVNKQLKCILHNIADAQIKEAVFLITQRDAKRAARGEITEAVRSFKTAASINRSSHYSRPLLWHSQRPVAFTENSSLKSCTSMSKSSKLKHFQTRNQSANFLSTESYKRGLVIVTEKAKCNCCKLPFTNQKEEEEDEEATASL